MILTLGVRIGGYGQHIEVVIATPSRFVNYFKMLYIVQIMYPITIAFIKWSILAFYRHIFSVGRAKIPLYTIGGIIVAWLIVVVSIKLWD